MMWKVFVTDIGSRRKKILLLEIVSVVSARRANWLHSWKRFRVKMATRPGSQSKCFSLQSKSSSSHRPVERIVAQIKRLIFSSARNGAGSIYKYATLPLLG